MHMAKDFIGLNYIIFGPFYYHHNYHQRHASSTGTLESVTPHKNSRALE